MARTTTTRVSRGVCVALVVAAMASAMTRNGVAAFVFVVAALIVWFGAAKNDVVGPVPDDQQSEAARIERLRSELEFFRDYENQYDESAPSGFVFGRDEHVIAMMSGAALMESRRGPSEFRGGALGVSLRVTDRVSVRPTGFRGRSVPGEEAPTVIDEGSFIVTDQRGIFVGQKQSREFPWSKLLSYQVVNLVKGASVLYLPTSGRQKVSGIGADDSAVREVEQRVAFAVAVATGRREAFIQRIKDELHSLENGGDPTTGTLPPPTH